MSLTKLAIDRQNRKLVNYNGTPVDFPPLYQFNILTLRIYPLDPPASVNQTYQQVDASAFGLRVAICSQPTGTTTDDTRLAWQDTFTWDSSGRYWSGSLALNTTAIATYLSTSAGRTAWAEVNMMNGSDPITILQKEFSLQALGDNFSTVVPSPTDQYYTRVQSDDRFAKKSMAAGERIVLISPNGLYGVELGCDDDGSFITNSITI